MLLFGIIVIPTSHKFELYKLKLDKSRDLY